MQAKYAGHGWSQVRDAFLFNLDKKKSLGGVFVYTRDVNVKASSGVIREERLMIMTMAGMIMMVIV